MPVLDEEGFDPEGEVPPFVTEATLKRWLVCEQIAMGYCQQPGGHPENSMLATQIFASDLEMGDIPDELQEAVNRQALSRIAKLRRRSRLGRFAKEAHKPLKTPPPRSPGTHYTEQEIRDAGLDGWPEKGSAARRILGDARDTAEMFSLGQHEEGIPIKVPYRPGRSTLHDEIVAKFKEGKTPPEGKPHAVFTAGGPASGKTTVLKLNPQLTPPAQNTVHIDPDLIQEHLPEYQTLREAGDRYAAMAVHREAGDIAARLLLESLAEGYHVVIDGTGDSGRGDFVRQIEAVRGDDDYTVDLIYVNVPTDQAVSWAIRRAEDEGRFVPVPVIRDMHAKVSENFLADVVDLPYLNSLEVLDRGQRVATLIDGKMVVLDDDLYAAFLSKADEPPPDLPPRPRSPGTKQMAAQPLPPVPTFHTPDKATRKQNIAAANEMLALAQKGDVEALKSYEVHPKAKRVAKYKEALVGALGGAEGTPAKAEAKPVGAVTALLEEIKAAEDALAPYGISVDTSNSKLSDSEWLKILKAAREEAERLDKRWPGVYEGMVIARQRPKGPMTLGAYDLHTKRLRLSPHVSKSPGHKNKYGQPWSVTDDLNGVFRHESGHFLDYKWDARMRDALKMTDFRDKDGHELTTPKWAKRNLSEYAGTMTSETIAEMWARFTADDYHEGEMPTRIEQIMEALATGTEPPPPEKRVPLSKLGDKDLGIKPTVTW